MKNNVLFLTSDLLTNTGIDHGWFMRSGGVSKVLFDSLNGKKGNGDSDSNVDENRRRALNSVIPAQAGIQASNNQLTHIIHEFKNNILEATESGEFCGYDASITTGKDIVLSQTTADCGTIIIADTEGTVVSLVHGSWHTLSLKIIRDTVAKLKVHTSNELIAAIGPMICKNCYVFGPEAKDYFDSKYLKLVSRHSRAGGNPVQVDSAKSTHKKYLVDLKQMILDQLTESGITKIDDVNVCTLEDDRFFSHRRLGANSGRLITLAKL